MIGFPNPWLLVAMLLAIGGAATGGYVKGRVDKGNAVLADQVREQKVVDAVQKSVGDWLATYEGKTTIIRQKAVETVRENTVYKDCVVPEDMQQLIRDSRIVQTP